MGIFKRVGDIVSANLNDMVERFESPETMLRQAIREMDAAVARQMESAARVIADKRLIENELGRSRERSAELESRAREAVGRNDDTAARRWLSQRHEHQQLIAALDDQLATVRSTGDKLRRQLDAMRVRRREAERTLHVLIARNRAATARRQMAGAREAGPTDATGFARFDRLREKVERHEAESEAFLELEAAVDLVDDFVAKSNPDVESELHEIKRQLGS
jgi:phage shock protein A